MPCRPHDQPPASRTQSYSPTSSRRIEYVVRTPRARPATGPRWTDPGCQPTTVDAQVLRLVANARRLPRSGCYAELSEACPICASRPSDTGEAASSQNTAIISNIRTSECTDSTPHDSRAGLGSFEGLVSSRRLANTSSTISDGDTVFARVRLCGAGCTASLEPARWTPGRPTVGREYTGLVGHRLRRPKSLA